MLGVVESTKHHVVWELLNVKLQALLGEWTAYWQNTATVSSGTNIPFSLVKLCTLTTPQFHRQWHWHQTVRCELLLAFLALEHWRPNGHQVLLYR